MFSCVSPCRLVYIFTDVSKRRCTEHLQGQAITRRDGPEDLSDNPHRSEKSHCCQPRLLIAMFHPPVYGDPEFNTFSVSLHSVTNLFCGAATQREPWPHSFTHNDAPQSVGLIWTSDQLVAETCTWQHTTLRTDKYQRLRWDSNPQSQPASGRRPTP